MGWLQEESQQDCFETVDPVRFAKGTGCHQCMPEGNAPKAKLQALQDLRVCFDAIRRGFLEYCGGDLRHLLSVLNYIPQNLQPKLREEAAVMEFSTTIL